MATSCRFAAPLGLARPLSRRATAAAGNVVVIAKHTQVLHSNTARGRLAVVKAADGTSGGGEDATTEVPEIVKAAQDAWAKVEDKYAVSAIAVAGLVALWTAVGALKAIGKLPILPGVLELVGIGYTGWFTYRNLIFQPDRSSRKYRRFLFSQNYKEQVRSGDGSATEYFELGAVYGENFTRQLSNIYSKQSKNGTEMSKILHRCTMPWESATSGTINLTWRSSNSRRLLSFSQAM